MSCKFIFGEKMNSVWGRMKPLRCLFTIVVIEAIAASLPDSQLHP